MGDETRENKMLYVAFLFLSTFLGATGQIFFKIGVVSSTSVSLAFYVLVGIFAYALSTLVYFYVLSRTHLSWAYSFGGLSYIFASIMAFAFLNEQVPAVRWIGILVIAVGTFLIGIS